jgi:hypothetical protein
VSNGRGRLVNLSASLKHEGMKSQKSDYSQVPIEAPTDAIALKRDSNFSSFPAKVLFDFVIDNVCLNLRASFAGLLEKVLMSASRMEQR